MSFFFIGIKILLVFVFSAVVGSSADICHPTRCRKNGPLIQFPFRLTNSQPHHCGFSSAFDLHCNRNKETILQLPVSVNVSLRNINYTRQAIEFHDPDNCLPRKIPNLNLSTSPFNFIGHPNDLFDMVLYNCSTDPIREPLAISCLGVNGNQVISENARIPLDKFPSVSCTRSLEVRSVPDGAFHSKYIWLRWTEPSCGQCEERFQFCRISSNNTATGANQIQCVDKPKRPSKTALIAGATASSIIFVAILAALYYVYGLIKRDMKIEKFLKDYKALRPTRFSYDDIKHITKGFSKKLGEGCYGVVYKGKLSNEICVAVKVLSSAKGEGKEFVNEVGIIGSIHHVNIVRLVGFCADGFRRALVYEYLPNDSLEKFIFRNGPEEKSLSWKKMQDIAIGVAKGIEYLHQGCDQRILHFDIKPHNVLLDHNLNPKICDFGLAKFCSKEQSAVSMTNARGTMGYISPEMMSRTFGRVSYKSDVYSFGMMLLEMVGGRMRRDDTRNKTDVYFPIWIYNQFSRGDHEMWMKIDDDDDDSEESVVRKIIVVGLWCIQWYPIDRPSMKMVVHMLEGDGQNLTFPPNPFPGMNVGSDIAVANVRF